MYQRTHLSDEERVVIDRVRQRNTRLNRAGRTPDQIERERNLRHPDGTKHCNRCGRDRAFDQFTPFAREPDGLRTHCMDCIPGSRTDDVADD